VRWNSSGDYYLLLEFILWVQAEPEGCAGGIASVFADRINLIPAAADKIENGPAGCFSLIKNFWKIS
jgi:hypothetical protein